MALLKKLSWSLLTDDSFIFRFLRRRFFSNSFTQYRFWKSSIRCGLRSHIQSLIDESIWAPGRNSKIHFWSDDWLGSPLIRMIDCNDTLEPDIDTTVGEFVSDYEWSLPTSFTSDFPMINEEIRRRIRLDGSVIDLWLDALEANFSSQVSQLWRSAIVIAVWII
ncbi:hypothetical protein PanWU01x14_013810 [Parasponia andersonii]|uniref:Reverse transcriptase zinc-binding domain-containing protein n=1 Tax=Parasponia andersonii TaxID=3476 RepID=A0A2P5E144_PARAD|nr:hypothetical protein PanWU01x14_013810 [Parasponia andersonii]